MLFRGHKNLQKVMFIICCQMFGMLLSLRALRLEVCMTGELVRNLRLQPTSPTHSHDGLHQNAHCTTLYVSKFDDKTAHIGPATPLIVSPNPANLLLAIILLRKRLARALLQRNTTAVIAQHHHPSWRPSVQAT